jgi:uncharacterized protein YyaL (SSP411 family)
VDWYPWGEEAFAKAKAEQKPVFLSVGYAACHWCHVMERESFESEEIARILNDKFVSIKVDREERPDVDDLYMTAVQMIAGRGGWPMSVFVTPEGKPFYGGTYYPPDDFKKLLNQIAEVWKTRKPEILTSSDRLAKAIQNNATSAPRPSSLKPRELLKLALDSLKESFDPVNGGFSQAPKFPPHNSLALLLSDVIQDPKSKVQNQDIAFKTLDAMAIGGIRDHLGGGFHRYSTDAKWLVPHFEKMLYDNALLARAYADAAKLGDQRSGYVAGETLQWAMREMRGPEGGFYSSLDADSEGAEGKYYVWKQSEIRQILGPIDGPAFGQLFEVKTDGNYREQSTGELNGNNILHTTPGVKRFGNRSASEPGTIQKWCDKLLAARSKRVRPALDDKRVAGWNGLMIAALARCATVEQVGDKTFRDSLWAAASESADFVMEKMHPQGKLLRSWRPGASNMKPGVLEDYAFVIDGLLEMCNARGAGREWNSRPTHGQVPLRGLNYGNALRLNQARELADEMIARFADPTGGFFDTPVDGEKLLVRGKNPYDGALPSPNAVAARDLYRLAKATGDDKYLKIARATVNALSGYAERNPAGCQTLILAAVEMDNSAKGSAVKSSSQASSGPVSVSVQSEPVVAGQEGQLVVSIQIKTGWHINADRPLDKSLIGTRVTADPPEGLVVGAVRYPKAEKFRLGFSKDELAVYTGKVSVAVPVKVARSARKGSYQVPLRIRFQACDDNACLAPVTLNIVAAITVSGAGK